MSLKESPPLWWLVYSKKVWINFYIVSPGHTWMQIHLLCPYYQNIVVERRTLLPSKDDHVVIFRTCDCVVLCGKRTLQVRLNWGFWGGKIILDYLCSLTVIPGAHGEEDRGVRVTGDVLTLQRKGRETRRSEAASLLALEMEKGAKECRQPLGTRRRQEADSPLEPPEGTKLFWSLMLAL